MEFRHSVICSTRGINECLVTLLELFNLAGGVGVSLCYSYSRYTAFNGCVNGCIALSSVIKRALHSRAIMQCYKEKDRHAGEDDKRKYPVDSYKINEGQDYHYRAYKQILRTVVRKLADLKKITTYSRHNASGLVVIIEFKG